MSNKVSGLNDKAFELAFRLFEEYRSRRERQEQYLIDQRQGIDDSRPVPKLIEDDPKEPADDLLALEDILSTFDDEDKRLEFEAFVDLLPIMVEERHGLCTGLDSKTIDDALARDVTVRDVASYVANNAAVKAREIAYKSASKVASAVCAFSAAVSCAIKDHTLRVYHGFWPSTHQESVSLTVDTAPAALTIANANAQMILGIGSTWGAIGYLYYLREVIDGYLSSYDAANAEKAASIGFLSAIIALEGIIRKEVAERTGKPCGSSIGVLMSIPSHLRSWYHEKRREVAVKSLRLYSEEGSILLSKNDS